MDVVAQKAVAQLKQDLGIDRKINLGDKKRGLLMGESTWKKPFLNAAKWVIPSGNLYIAIENGDIEIASFPSKNGYFQQLCLYTRGYRHENLTSTWQFCRFDTWPNNGPPREMAELRLLKVPRCGNPRDFFAAWGINSIIFIDFLDWTIFIIFPYLPNICIYIYMYISGARTRARELVVWWVLIKNEDYLNELMWIDMD